MPIVTTAVIAALRRVHRDLQDLIANDPETAFEPILIGHRRKRAIGLDWYVECRMACELRRRLGPSRIRIVGEESLRDPSLDLSDEQRIVILLDILDGSDLAERALGNWCSAATVFYPPERRVLATYLAIPDTSSIYYATDDSSSSMRSSLWGKPLVRKVTGPSNIHDAGLASVAYYGQKPANFLSLVQTETVSTFLRSVADQQNDCGFRLYNFGGNPQLARVVDGHKRIDAVLDIEGQYPHDAVAGLFIAQRGGATVTSLGGEPLDLAESLLRPADPLRKIKYIVAATPELAQSLVRWFYPNIPKVSVKAA